MSKPTMIKIGADGNSVPNGSDLSHVAVLLSEAGLMFTATNVARGVPHAKCKKAAKTCRIAGFKDWRLPTSRELMLLIDHGRCAPAIDTDYFLDIASDWYWTDTPWVGSNGKASASVAWGVGFYDGDVYSNLRKYRGFALAVRRAGQ